MVHLFALLPAKNRIRSQRTLTCQRLVREWSYYVIQSRSLRKAFISIKGIYYQAEILGEKVTWLVPHKFSQNLPQDVDYRVMLTFLDFYEVFLQFVFFRLFGSIGLRYPPNIDSAKDAAGAYMDSLTAIQIDETPEPSEERGKILAGDFEIREKRGKPGSHACIPPTVGGNSGAERGKRLPAGRCIRGG
jgi:pescadillo protein